MIYLFCSLPFATAPAAFLGTPPPPLPRTPLLAAPLALPCWHLPWAWPGCQDALLCSLFCSLVVALVVMIVVLVFVVVVLVVFVVVCIVVVKLLLAFDSYIIFNEAESFLHQQKQLTPPFPSVLFLS